MRTPLVLIIAVAVVFAFALTGCTSLDAGGAPSAKTWPASSAGRPAFYYFGSGS